MLEGCLTSEPQPIWTVCRYHPKEAKGYDADDPKCKALNRLTRMTGLLARCTGGHVHRRGVQEGMGVAEASLCVSWDLGYRWGVMQQAEGACLTSSWRARVGAGYGLQACMRESSKK